MELNKRESKFMRGEFFAVAVILLVTSPSFAGTKICSVKESNTGSMVNLSANGDDFLDWAFGLHFDISYGESPNIAHVEIEDDNLEGSVDFLTPTLDDGTFSRDIVYVSRNSLRYLLHCGAGIKN